MHTFPAIERNKFSAFLSAISPWKDAYSEAIFSIIGLRSGDDIDVLRARMFLIGSGNWPSEVVVDTKSLIACRVRLNDIGESYETALEKLATCGLPTPFGTVRLTLTERENSPSCHFSSNGPLSGNAGKRTNYFALSGAQKNIPPALDLVTWDLMAAKRPYGSLSELADDLSIPTFRLEDRSYVDAVADSVLTIDKSKNVSGTVAKLGAILARGLKTDLCSLGYVVRSADGVISRGRVEGSELDWEESDAHHAGEYRLNVPKGAVVQIYATYDGNPQEADQIFDPDTFPNYRQAIHDAFDTDFVVLKKYLFGEKQKDARDLEVGVAILFFMLGFSIDPLVGKPLEDGPDLIACARSGDMLLIECTTSLINKEGKLAKLVDRVAIAKTKLREGPPNNVRVLPMIITTRPAESVAVMDRQTAEEQGVVILTKEDLETALNQARFPHDSDGFFERYWNSIWLGVNCNLNPLQQLISLPPQ